MPSSSTMRTTLATTYAMTSSSPLPESSSSRRACRRPRSSASESSFSCSPTGFTATRRSITPSSTSTSSFGPSHTYDPPAYSTPRPSSTSSSPEPASTSSSEPSHTYDPPAYSTSRPSSGSSPPDHSASPSNGKPCPFIALIVGSTLAALVLAVVILLLCFLALRRRRHLHNRIRVLDPPAPFDILSSYSSDFSVRRVEPYIITLPNDALNASASGMDSKDLPRSPMMVDGKQPASLSSSISLPALHLKAAEVHQAEYINPGLSPCPSSAIIPGRRTRFPDINEARRHIHKLESAWWTRFSNVPQPANAHLK